MFFNCVENFFPFFVSNAWFFENRFYLCPGFSGFIPLQQFLEQNLPRTLPPSAKATGTAAASKKRTKTNFRPWRGEWLPSLQLPNQNDIIYVRFTTFLVSPKTVFCCFYPFPLLFQYPGIQPQ